MEINNAKPGDFCWFELATSDQPAAKKFYGAMFNWTANDQPPIFVGPLPRPPAIRKAESA